MRRRDARPVGSILSLLPPALHTHAAPWEDHERMTEWSAARKAWCDELGFRLLDLIRAERPRGTPSKRRPTTPSGTRRAAN